MSTEASMLVTARRLVEAHPFLGTDPKRVLTWLTACTERIYRPGQQLCKEKTYGDEAFFVLDGRVIVSRLDRKGLPQTLATVVGPVLLGQLALIDNAIRTATLTAEGIVRVRALDRNLWRTMSVAPTAEGSSLRRIMLSSLQQQLYRTHEQITEIAAGNRAATPVPLPPQAGDKVIPVVRLAEDDFAPDHLTDDLTDEQKLEALNPYKR